MATTNRRRVLITLQPGDGHLPPLLPLSRALRAAGHEVVFATSPTFVARVEEAGERAVGAGLVWLLSDGPAQPAEPHGQRLTIRAHTQSIPASTPVPAWLAELDDAGSRRSPDRNSPSAHSRR